MTMSMPHYPTGEDAGAFPLPESHPHHASASIRLTRLPGLRRGAPARYAVWLVGPRGAVIGSGTYAVRNTEQEAREVIEQLNPDAFKHSVVPVEHLGYVPLNETHKEA